VEGTVTAGEARDLGSVGDEAAKLFAAVQDWARRTTGDQDLGERISVGSPECQVCPVCQLLRLLRGVSPEAFEHLSDAAASLTAAAREVIAAHEHDWAARRSSGVEHIDIR
jgi:hypothetical protein